MLRLMLLLDVATYVIVSFIILLFGIRSINLSMSYIAIDTSYR
jgi:hypothetical protein